jgi:cyclophilin family peptidyl-prolyl cis-trans isomerase
MARHAAPTDVTIASHQEPGLLHEWVRRYWKLALLVALALTAGILARVWLHQRSQATADASWDRLRQEVELGGGFTPASFPAPDVLGELASELQHDQAGPWAKAFQVRALVDAQRYDEARTAIADLEATWPKHPLVTEPLVHVEDAAPRTLPEHLRAAIAELERWKESHGDLFANPPLPADAPRVALATGKGEIVVGLYADRAPQHVLNFLKLVREGFYDGTRFHRVVADFMIQGGDPNSREGAPETWGQGGPGYTVPAELGELRHFTYVLAAAKKPNEAESSGSQFYITTAPAHALDGQHTVFGAVLAGEDVVDAIESGPVVGDRPQDPVLIESARVL